MSAATDSETYQSFVVSDPSADAATLRADMDDRGYLFFRRLIPADDVLAVRRVVTGYLAQAGWLAAGSDPMDAIADPRHEPLMEGHPEYMPVYRNILHAPLFHEFPAHPALMAIAAILIDGTVLVHPRRIGRITWPNYTAATTPAHQDHFYIRGTVQTYSCWTPLGDCPRSLGGLAVWPGSQHKGYIEHDVQHAGAVGGRGVPVDETEAVWHTIDFEAGDALFFHAYTIHKALPNLSGDHIRLSTDNRYQRQDDEIDPSALRPHFDLT